MNKKYRLILPLAFVCMAISFSTQITSSNKSNSDAMRIASKTADLKHSNCHIEVGNAILERKMKGFRDFDFLSVIVIARCNRFQNNVNVELEIWKRGRYFNHRVTKLTNGPANLKMSGYVVTFRNLGVTCKSRKQTVYYGIASVSATIDQKTMQTPQVISSTPTTLPCGT